MTSQGRRASAHISSNASASQKAAQRDTKTREFLVAAAASFLIALALTQSATAGAVPLPRGAGPGTFLHATPARPTGPSVEGQSAGSLAPLVTGGNGESLKYWGGEVQHKPELDLLFWGDNFWNGTQPFYEGVSLYTEYKGFYDDLSNELEAPGEASWQGILSQYFGKSGTYGDAHVVGETDETAINAPQNITVENIKKEITTWANRGLTQNPNTQVIVLAAPGTSYAEDPENGCGYHGIDEQGYSYTFVAYAGDLDHYFNKNKENYSCNYRAAGKEVETTQLMWSSTAIASHEFAEEVTDPGLNGEYAWFSNGKEEIGDLCDYEPYNSVELPEKNGRPGWWYVTELWDDGGGNTCKLEDPPYAEPSPPTATTEAATSIGYRQATLNGTLNPNGPEAHYDFEYGTTTSYGSKIPTSEASAGFGTTTLAESATVTGLKPGTKYHFRIVAKTYVGTTAGADKEFTTPIPPPAVTTETPTELGETRASLNATVNPEEFATTYQFEYWIAGKSSEVTKIPTTAVSVGSGSTGVKVSQHPALTNNIEYVYRVVATNVGGTSHGKEVSFVTGPYLENHTSANVSTSEGAQNVLYGVSCTSTTWCLSTGYDHIIGGPEGAPMGLSWTGASWSLVTTPTVPTGDRSASLDNGVSCTSSSACTAIGSQITSAGVGLPLVERWNGSTWIVQTTPSAPEKDGYVLHGVSCTSATSCIIAGVSVVGTLEGVPIAEIWNGSEWKMMTVPNVKGQFNAISCSSSSACTAVGGTGYNGEPLAARWNGTEWTMQTAAKIASAGLNGVSCPTSTSCVAEGISGGILGSPTVGVSETWNGTTWAPVVIPSTGAEQTALYGVSCSSATSCIAAGNQGSLVGVESSMADIWNGSNWKVMALTLPSGTTASALRGVSCGGPYCAAVGYYSNSGPASDLTLEGTMAPPGATTEAASSITANGATLNAAIDPNGRETTYHFEYGPTAAHGTSVPVPNAAETSTFSTEIEKRAITGLEPETTYHYRIVATNPSGTSDGADHTFVTSALSWALDSSENVSGAENAQNMLYGDSCISSAWCMSSGYYKVSGSEGPIAETYNGSSWKLTAAPVTPVGDRSASLDNGVSCTSSSACTAIGSQITSAGSGVPLVERWNGSSWAVQTTPAAPEKDGYLLYGVSCTSATACITVGDNITGAFESVPIAEIWNGSEWKMMTTPNVKGEFAAVSCSASNACTAVGGGTYGGEPIAARWNGTGWTMQTAAKISTAGLNGVSCPTSTSCVAEGISGGIFGSLTAGVSETWNGSTWTAVTIPPSGAEQDALFGVSCSSATLCYAVGDSSAKTGGEAAMADKWNGVEWKLVSLPLPSGNTGSMWRGVSCVTAGYCTTTGHYSNPAAYLTLADSN